MLTTVISIRSSCLYSTSLFLTLRKVNQSFTYGLNFDDCNKKINLILFYVQEVYILNKYLIPDPSYTVNGHVFGNIKKTFLLKGDLYGYLQATKMAVINNFELVFKKGKYKLNFGVMQNPYNFLITCLITGSCSPRRLQFVHLKFCYCRNFM